MNEDHLNDDNQNFVRELQRDYLDFLDDEVSFMFQTLVSPLSF